MKRALIAAALLVAAVLLRQADGQEITNVGEDRWPRTITASSTTFRVYQPQLDSWDGFALRAHAAIGVQTGPDAQRASYGVATFSANTIVNRETRLVRFVNLRILGVRFPSDPSKEAAYLAALREAAPGEIQGVALDRLEANLAVLRAQEKGGAKELANKPPMIVFSTAPALLVLVDGNPVFTPVKGTELSRVINTQVLLLKDKSGAFYLHVFDGYMRSTKITGPWSVAQAPPPGAAEAERYAESSKQIDLLRGEPDPKTGERPSLNRPRAPVIHVSLSPAELVVTAGEPDFVPLENTNLLYVENTTANVFKDLDDQRTYVLLTGRWFSSASFQGPWGYVPPERLPKDFANIPDASPKENVKASVPGTRQAREAVIANEVPSTTRLERGRTNLPLEVDGEPQLKSIEGTPLQYVFNASLPVVRVSARSWYAVYNGAWYTAAAVGGPWQVADRVPPVIYTIPATSPLYYVTYVKVYNATERYVYAGSTPGYYGAYVTPDGTVVYGTGYYYPAYVSPRFWFSPMITYGYGSSLRWTPWYGWSFGFGFGWGYPNFWVYPPAPYWGPYYIDQYYGRVYYPSWGVSTSMNVYRHAVPPQLQSQKFGQAYNSRTGANVMGHAPTQSIGNVFHGTAPGTPPSTIAPHALPRTEPPGQVSPAPSNTVPHGTPPGTTTPGAAPHGGNQPETTQPGATPPGTTPAPGTAPHGVPPSGTGQQGTTQPGSAQPGATPPSAPPAGTVPHGVPPQGATSQGAAPQGATSQGAVQQGMDDGIYGTPNGDVYYYQRQDNQWQHLNPPSAPSGQQSAPPASPAPGNLDDQRSAREQGDTRTHIYQPYEQPSAPAGPAPAAPPPSAPAPGPSAPPSGSGSAAPGTAPHMGGGGETK